MLKSRGLLVIALALVLVMMMFTLLGPASKRGIATRLADAAPGAQVNVNCASNPETTSVTNNLNKSIKIKTVGSIYQPRSDEPFKVNRKLKPGKTITFQSGSKAKGKNKLTKAFIYNNDVGRKEGAKVKTSVGKSVDHCG